MIVAGTHDTALVILSVVIAAFASFTALSLAARLRAASGRSRPIWLLGAAVALGGGVWAMHFVAMLAFSMPGMTTSYDLGLTLLSLAIAISFTAAGFALMSKRPRTGWRVPGAGLLMGVGVVAMHYLGMAAMQMDATLSYGRIWLTVSVLIAIGAATAAVWLASLEHAFGRQVGAASLMGLAIAGMHYAGMKAAVFTASPHVELAEGTASISQTYLALAISVITFLILLLALGAAKLERVFQTNARREARIALRLKITDLLRDGGTDEALEQVVRLTGEHFRVSRAGYGVLDAQGDLFRYDVCWTDGSVQPLLGVHPARAFGPQIVAALVEGRTVAIPDLFANALSSEAATLDTARQVDTRAILVVPFVRDGQLRTIVYLNSREVRHWLPEDIRFMEELAERTRLVVERMAVEDRLRELNATLEARVEARTQELQKAEEGRRQADALYRAYFENTPDPLFVIAVRSGNFLIEEINPAHEAGVGFTLSAVRGKRIEDVLPAKTAEQVIATYRHVVATGTTHEYRDTFELSGETQHWDTTLVPLTDESGQVVRIIGSSRNVTRQITAEEALRQSQKMEAIGQLTGGVAHDFNNLLTPILGSLDILMRKGTADARERRLLEGAAQAADRAKTLVQRLLAFARRQPLQPVPVNLSELVAGLTELIASTCGPRIEVRTAISPSLPFVKADPNQMEMALLNLAVNARDAMLDGGSITIAAETVDRREAERLQLKPGAYVRLMVADTGIGMDAETRRRAIEPFYSTKGVGKGTGLGLSMVHGLAAQLGGTLTIESAVGEGTTVALLLPVSAEARAARDLQSVEPAAGAGGTVLLVDDDELARVSTSAMLAELGYGVVDVSSAEEALRLIEADLELDLLLTDYLMPGMSGADLARRVMILRPDTPVLIISGYADAEGIATDLNHLSKPFRQSDLAKRLRDLSVRRVQAHSAAAE